MTHENLIANGYLWAGRGCCDACGDPVLWYRNWNRKSIPFNPKTFDNHFATCTKKDAAQREREASEAEEEKRRRAEEQRFMLLLHPPRAIYFDDRADANKLKEQRPARREKKRVGVPGQQAMEFDA